MNDTVTLRDKLVNTASQLYLRLGIKSVSMDDVAREMGVSKKTIYQVVDNKEELVNMVMELDFCDDMQVIERNLHESHDAIDEFLRNGRYHIRSMREISPATLRDLKKYYPQIWHESMVGHQNAFKRVIISNIERGMEEGLYRADLQPDIIAQLYVATVVSVVDTSIFPAADRTISEIIYHHATYHLNGIVNQFGRDRMEAYLKQEALD